MTILGRKILLGVTGGIAAYKAPELVRHLKKAGAEVQVVLSQSANEFVTKLSLSAVSGRPVYDALFGEQDSDAPMRHIELARWPDLVLIAPATANCIAALAHGFANDLLSSLCLGLAPHIPLYVAPAMNSQMWEHAATKMNIKTLSARGLRLLGPDWGEQACKEIGFGRMMEPEQIVSLLTTDCPLDLSLLKSKLSGKKILITAGPTQEAIDPIRYMTNKSSGKMGFAIASVAQKMGAEVILVSGPVKLDTPWGVRRVDVETAQQMQRAVFEKLSGCDIFIATAAVADYRCENIAEMKLKKQINQAVNLKLIPNPDILAEVANSPLRPFCVGFAAETNAPDINAQIKLEQKNLDMIVLNDITQPGAGFDVDTNSVTVYWRAGQRRVPQVLPLASKMEIAKELLLLIEFTRESVYEQAEQPQYSDSTAENTG